MSNVPIVTVPLQTFKRAFAEICTGEGPWIALGKFMHQFFGAYSMFRAELVREPIELPQDMSPDLFRWAVFCAASVEYLCHTYDLPCPSWVLDECYRLEDPWFYDLAGDLPEVQEELRETTSEEFARRNVFCGDDVYRNKYEHRRR
ncbi:MAG: hypothetical protein ABI234_20425, partial [Ktedonobacteraceae bacterium]